MRDILFRGKRADNGEWVYGDALHNGVDYISAIRISDPDDSDYGSVVKVDPDTVGQYIGAGDKKEEMIFDGDILERKYNDGQYAERCVVRFGNSCGFGDYLQFTGFNYDLDIDTTRCEILGNVHDNPELLEA